MDLKSCYDILEIGNSASPREIKQAYRDLIRVWHPDRFPNNGRLIKKAETKIKALNEAYRTIVSDLNSNSLALDDAASESDSGNTRIIAVASGKGGVGKTNFSLNIAVALKELEENVTILDADLGMANIDVLCGLAPKYNLGDVIRRERRLEEVILEIFGGVKLIPGVSGVEAFTAIDKTDQVSFLREIKKLETKEVPGIVLIDVGAGMGTGVIGFLLAASEIIIITTPEPTALMDAYALIKTVLLKQPDADVGIVVNMVKSREEAERIFSSVNRITGSFLHKEIKYLGHIINDKAVQQSVKKQTPYYLAYPNSKAGECIREIAGKISRKSADVEHKGGIQAFFKRMSMLLFETGNGESDL